MTESLNQLITKVFVEQHLALPGSANFSVIDNQYHFACLHLTLRACLLKFELIVIDVSQYYQCEFSYAPEE